MQLFGAAIEVLRKIGEDARIIHEFVELDNKTKVAAIEARDAETALGDIPDEFLDPIQVHHYFLEQNETIHKKRIKQYHIY